MFALTLDAFRVFFRRPWPLKEFLRVSWFIVSVSIVPVILVSVAFGATIALQVGNVSRQLGAQSQTGAAMVLAVVREAAPIATALLISGAGGSAMTADLGSRKVREELDAMEVLAVDPVHRLVVPRILAAVVVAVLLNGFVSVAGVGGFGAHLSFYGVALANIPAALRRRAEILRHVSEITIGAGALIVGAGTAGVIFFMAFFTGTQVGLEGFKGLQLIGAEAFTGFVSAFANTREITPLIAGITLAAQVGAGFTAELGAMRISEEIDATEVIAVRPIPYLVSTRIIAAVIAVMPLYLISLFSSYFATKFMVV